MKKRFKLPGKITIVCGRPGSGKTTWCNQQASGKDLIWDLDKIAGQLHNGLARNANRNIEMNDMLGRWRDDLLKTLRTAKLTNNAYVIISDVKKAKQVSKKYGFNLKVINNASRTA